mgnify:CR=1 FL=1
MLLVVHAGCVYKIPMVIMNPMIIHPFTSKKENGQFLDFFEICDEYVSCKVYEISDQRIKEIL